MMSPGAVKRKRVVSPKAILKVTPTETIPKSENSTVVVPRQRSVFAWNEMKNYTDSLIESLVDIDLMNPFEGFNSKLECSGYLSVESH